MAETFQNTAEGGTNTTAVTTGNSGGASGDAWTSVTSTPTFTTVSPLDGSVSYSFSATATQFLDWDAVAAWSDFAYYFYFDFPSNPVTSLHTMANFRSLSGSLTSTNITPSGELTVTFPVGGAGPTVPLTAATRYRVEGQCTAFGTAASTHALQVYAGTSTTALDSILATGATTALPAQRVRWGRPSGTTTLATGLRMDTFKVVFGSAAVITPISPATGPRRRSGILVSDRPRRLWDPRRTRELIITGVHALGSFNADVTGTTTAGGSVSALVGDVGAVTGTTVADGSTSGVVGKLGTVTGPVTPGGTVAATVTRFGAVTGGTIAGGTVAAQLGDVGAVTGTTSAAGTVVSVVARFAAVTGTTTAAGTVNASTVTGLLGDVTGTTAGGGTVAAAMAATATVTGGTTTAGGSVAGLIGVRATITGTTASSGTVTGGALSDVAGTTTAGDVVSGQVAASTTTAGTTTASGTVAGRVGKFSGLNPLAIAMTGTVAAQLGTALAVAGTTTAGGTVAATVARFGAVTGTTTITSEVSVGAATVGQIHQGQRPVGGPQPGKRPVGGPRATIRG